MGLIKTKRELADLQETVEAIDEQKLELTNGVLWLPTASPVPTAGQAGKVGLFVEGGVLKAVFPDNSVEVVSYEE